MVDIDVAKPFTLTEDGGERIHFKAGPQGVDERYANHWYVQAHLVGAKPNPSAGSPAHLRAAAERRAQLEAEQRRLAAEADEAVTAEVRRQMGVEMQDRIAEAIKQGAEAATKGEDARIEAAVAQRVAGIEAGIEARIKAAVDEAVLNAQIEFEEQSKAAEAAKKAGAKGGK